MSGPPPPLSYQDERDLLALFAGTLEAGYSGGGSGHTSLSAALDRAAAYSEPRALAQRLSRADARAAADAADLPRSQAWQFEGETMHVSETISYVPGVLVDYTDHKAADAQALRQRLALAAAKDGEAGLALQAWYGHEGTVWSRRPQHRRRWALAGLTPCGREWGRSLLGGTHGHSREQLAKKLAEESEADEVNPKPARGVLLTRLEREIDALADRMRAAWHATPTHRPRENAA